MNKSKFDNFSSRRVNVKFDNGRFPRGRIGIVLVQMEQITDSEAYRIIPEGVGIHFSRVEMKTQVTVDNLREAGEKLPDAAKRCVPDLHLDAIGYGCTSGSLCITEEYAKAQLLKRGNVEKATTMITGVINGLRAVGAVKIAVVTPYLDEINKEEGVYLKEKGFDVINLQGMNLVNDFDIARVSPDFICDFAEAANRQEADAVFISCGALRSAEIIEKLENRIHKPVITSNQAFLWDLLRLANINDQISHYGALFNI